MNVLRVKVGPRKDLLPCCMCLNHREDLKKITNKQIKDLLLLSVKVKVFGQVCSECAATMNDVMSFRNKVILTQCKISVLLESKKQPPMQPYDGDYRYQVDLSRDKPGAPSNEPDAEWNGTEFDYNKTELDRTENTERKQNETSDNRTEIGTVQNESERLAKKINLAYEEPEIEMTIKTELDAIPCSKDATGSDQNQIDFMLADIQTVKKETEEQRNYIKIENMDAVVEVDSDDNENGRSHIPIPKKPKMSEIRIKIVDAAKKTKSLGKRRSHNPKNKEVRIREIKLEDVDEVIQIDDSDNEEEQGSVLFEDLSRVPINAVNLDAVNKDNKTKMDSLTATVNKNEETKLKKKPNGYIDKMCTKHPIALEDVKKILEQIRNTDEFKGAPWPCAPCAKRFYSEEHYDAHVRSTHDPLNLHECTVCAARLPDEAAERNHFRQLHLYMHKCKFCTFETTESTSLTQHFRTWHRKGTSKGKAPTVCPICKKVVASTHLSGHLWTAHGEVGGEVAGRGAYCGGCDRVFETEEYERHLKDGVHEGMNNMFACVECGARFSRKGALRRHVRGGHRARRACGVCQMSFTTVDEFKSHEKIHEEEEAKSKNICSCCGKGFLNENLLKEHMHSYHENETPYQCDMCSDTFAFSSGLANHRRLKHFGVQRTYSKRKAVKEDETSSMDCTEPSGSVDAGP